VRERRGGVPLIVILVVPPILAPILVMCYDEISGARKRRNEAGVMEAMRTIARSQATFREQDRDNDNILDYATDLAELEQAGLIDNAVADGLFKGYQFCLSGSTFDWRATADPTSERSGDRNFMVCTSGQVQSSLYEIWWHCSPPGVQ
jgi:hypothetical protein